MVARDRTVTLDGNLFEAPVLLIGKRVLLMYHENEPGRVEVFFEQASHGFLVPVDIHVKLPGEAGSEQKTPSLNLPKDPVTRGAGYGNKSIQALPWF